MQPLILTSSLAGKVAALFDEMETAYGAVAEGLDFSCDGCPDNCCDSYFLHYTYVEWAYLRQGFASLPEEQRETVLARAAEYIRQSEAALGRGERPLVMCPLNEKGRCILYGHRPMICRLHGVPATITRPDGRTTSFPGCCRCQEIVSGRPAVSPMERNVLFRGMVELETELLRQCTPRPRVKTTIARMLLQEPPPAVTVPRVGISD